MFRGRLLGAITLANVGSRLNCSMRAPRPNPHPGIMGVLRWPSLSVIEKRFPSPSMTLSDEVSRERDSEPPSEDSSSEAVCEDESAVNDRGESSATGSIFIGSPQGGMSLKA